MYRIVFSKQSRKSLKKLERSGRFDRIETGTVLNVLASGKSLEPKYRNHRLQGKYRDCFECHIKSDLLLIYYADEGLKELTVVDIGSHSDLFE